MMNLELFFLNGYGQFVWPAFIFTFVICSYLYLKTKKEFKKFERIFLAEFEQSKAIKFKVIAQKSAKENLSKGSIF